jgi:peptidoglycan hydrolase CwlO-like protein
LSKAESLVSTLEQFNKLSVELSQKMESLQGSLMEAIDILARIRLSQISVEKELKALKEKTETLEKYKHKHFWQKC